MVLKTKVSLGIGFLFFIIFILVFFCSFYVGSLGLDVENILKDNYKSISYARNMFTGLDDMKTAVSVIQYQTDQGQVVSDYYQKLFESGKNLFQTNLQTEKNNITEFNEKEYTDDLIRNYDVFLKIALTLKSGSSNRLLYFNDFLPACEHVRQSINNIYDVNMHAVVRKSDQAKRDSARFINFMAIIGSICIVLALGYFWYFPVYVSTTISYLSDRMKNLLKSSGFSFDPRTNDEAYVMLQAINLLENKLAVKKTDQNG